MSIKFRNIKDGLDLIEIYFESPGAEPELWYVHVIQVDREKKNALVRVSRTLGQMVEPLIWPRKHLIKCYRQLPKRVLARYKKPDSEQPIP